LRADLSSLRFGLPHALVFLFSGGAVRVGPNRRVIGHCGRWHKRFRGISRGRASGGNLPIAPVFLFSGHPGGHPAVIDLFDFRIASGGFFREPCVGRCWQRVNVRLVSFLRLLQVQLRDFDGRACVSDAGFVKPRFLGFAGSTCDIARYAASRATGAIAGHDIAIGIFKQGAHRDFPFGVGFGAGANFRPISANAKSFPTFCGIPAFLAKDGL
jgi:hypothetical protein